MSSLLIAPALADTAASSDRSLELTLVVRTLALRFAELLAAPELPALRGAIAAAAGPGATLFHQHQPDGGLRYAYPLIHYRISHGQPTLFCLQEGVEAAQLFLQHPAWELNLGGQPLTLTLADMRVQQHRLLLLPADIPPPLPYRVRQWLPFNEKNYAQWQAEPSLAARYALLEKLLTGHLLAFASGVGWHVPGPLRVALTNVRECRGAMVKGVRRVTFDAEFRANVSLPDSIGLGRHVSLGYGVVEKIRLPQPAADDRRRAPRTRNSFDPTAE